MYVAVQTFSSFIVILLFFRSVSASCSLARFLTSSLRLLLACLLAFAVTQAGPMSVEERKEKDAARKKILMSALE